MKKLLKIFFEITLVAAVAIGGSNGKVLAASQSENQNSLSGDLCGGTNGNGEIISVGSNTFILKLNDGGNKVSGNLIVNLKGRATIETTAGIVSLPDLKIGDRVTLVGDNNRDGTFTADAVVVCSEHIRNQESGAGEANHITVRNKNPEEYEKINRIINTATILLVCLIWLAVVLFLLVKKKKRLVFLLFFTVFYIYLYKVLDYTLLQFQTLLLLQHFVPNLMLNGFRAGANMNLIPLLTLKIEDVQTSLLNILMMIPFGFGLPFISSFHMKKVVIAGLFVSIIIEFLQLITGFMANTTFRVADINDLIFNTLGVAIGYMLFVGFVHIYRHILHNWKNSNSVLKFIGGLPQIEERNK